MKRPDSNGQALIMALIILPILLLSFGILARAGRVLLISDQVENHCGKKVLDALAIKGRGLKTLGQINPWARAVISARRNLDHIIEAGMIAPADEPPLLLFRQKLVSTQEAIQRLQNKITASSLSLFYGEIHKPSPRNFQGKIIENYKTSSRDLSLERDSGYENETGAPLEPAPDFERKQETTGTLKVFTERFLWRWLAPLPPRGYQELKSQNMQLNCRAKLEMARLEDPWKAYLMTPAK